MKTHGNRDRVATTRSRGAIKVARKHEIAEERTRTSTDEENNSRRQKLEHADNRREAGSS